MHTHVDRLSNSSGGACMTLSKSTAWPHALTPSCRRQDKRSKISREIRCFHHPVDNVVKSEASVQELRSNLAIWNIRLTTLANRRKSCPLKGRSQRPGAQWQ